MLVSEAHLHREVLNHHSASQFGGRVGGPIIKDKFFYFLDGERTKQGCIRARYIPFAI
jgi:hypothetical protein